MHVRPQPEHDGFWQGGALFRLARGVTFIFRADRRNAGEKQAAERPAGWCRKQRRHPGCLSVVNRKGTL